MASAGYDVFNDSQIECSICFENMLGEIMLCPSGHSLCKGCYDKMNPRRCPFCKNSLVDTRNISLEKLLKKKVRGKLDNWLNDSVTQCNQCLKPMDSQIGVCGKGHSLCTECTKKDKSCHICQSKIAIPRNFHLESCIRKMKKERIFYPPPSQILNTSIGQKTIICPMPNCAFKDVCLSRHILSEHKQQTFTLKPNSMFRIAVKNSTEKNLIFRILESTSEIFIIVRVKVSNSFMKVNAEQITKGSEHVLYIEHLGYHTVGMYRFKYASSGESKKTVLKTESLQLSKLGEYVIKVSFSEKTGNQFK